jgi:hypothetical protein
MIGTTTASTAGGKDCGGDERTAHVQGMTVSVMHGLELLIGMGDVYPKARLPVVETTVLPLVGADKRQ